MPASNLIFNGFEPSNEVRDVINMRLGQILDESPSESTLTASFTKHGGVYKGIFLVNYATGFFKAESIHDDPEDVVFELVSILRNQLKNWRKERFTDDITA